MFWPTDPAEAPPESQYQKPYVREEIFETLSLQLQSGCNDMKKPQAEYE